MIFNIIYGDMITDSQRTKSLVFSLSSSFGCVKVRKSNKEKSKARLPYVTFSIIECFGQNIICSNLQKLLDNAWSGFLLQTQRQQGYWVCTSMLEGIYIQETSRSKLCKLSHM